MLLGHKKRRSKKPGVGGGYPTLDPDNKDDGITLSGGSKTFLATEAGWRSAISTADRASGKLFCELLLPDVTWPGDRIMFGVARINHAIDAFIGGAPTDYSLFIDGGGNYFKTYNNAAPTGTDLGNPRDGVYGLCALDLTSKKVWFGKHYNDVTTWANGGDPAAGTGEQYSGLSGSFAIAISTLTSGDLGTLNYGETPFVADVPSGFGGWG